MGRGPRQPNKIVYGVTAGVSAWALLKGQLSDMGRRGWDVVVAATPDAELAAAAEREGVRGAGVPMKRDISPVDDVRALIAWVRLLRRERPAVINVGTPKAALLGGIAGVLTGVPRRIYVVRGLRYEGVTGPRRVVLAAMEKLTVACATDVVIVSRSVALRMHDDLSIGRPLLLIGEGSSNGVDGLGLAERSRAVDADAVRRGLGIATGSFVVGFVGRITEDKGVETLTEALGRVEGVTTHLVVVGDAEEGETTRRLDSLSDVTVTGWTDEPWRFIAALDVLILPTRREGYPNVVLEANACGIPVITTRATGAVDSVEHERTGLLVEVGDADGLARAIEILAADEPRRREMAHAARDRVLSRFTPSRIWDGLHSVYTCAPTKDIDVL